MTRDEFAAKLDMMQRAERQVRADGQKEYAHDENNCFANFDSDAEHGVSRLQSIMTHANKHFRGLQAYVNGHRSQRENIQGRLKDARLYLALLWAAIDEEERLEMSNPVPEDQEYGCECGWSACQCLPDTPYPTIQQQFDRDQSWKVPGVLAARAEKQLTKNRVEAKGLEMCDCNNPEFCYCSVQLDDED